MKKILLLTAVVATTFLASCQKDKTKSPADNYGDGARTNVPAGLQGNWMYGNFSMTEYWNQNPGDYLGNAFQFAIAFKFNANGTYEHYFTSSSVTGGVTNAGGKRFGTKRIDRHFQLYLHYRHRNRWYQCYLLKAEWNRQPA
jgi:hypothetical protein